MILNQILPRNSLWKYYIYRSLKVSKNLEGYTLMSGNEKSFLPTDPEPEEPVVKKTLATDISLKIIGSGARGAPASVCLYTNETRYIFNCGESTQRINNEHKNKLCKLSKIGNVFITTPTWKNIGGLPGFLLCLQSYGVTNVNVHGPVGTIDVVDATRRFVYLKKLSVTERNLNKPFVDTVLTVNYVPLEPPKTNEATDNFTNDNETIEDNTDYYEHVTDKHEKRKAIIYGNNVKRVKRDSHSVTGQIKGSMCYIGKIHPRTGRLNLEKCVEKGVKPGPMLGQLKCGRDITLPDGSIVKSVDVVDPPDPGPVFIVVDCPREDLVQCLVNNPIFNEHQSASATSKDMIALCVVHFTPEKILRDARYLKWMEKFGWTTQHIIVNEANTCLGTEAVHKVQHQLHLLHDTIFPFLDQSHIKVDKNFQPKLRTNVRDTELESSSENDVAQYDQSLLIHRAKTLHSFSLYPRKGLYVNSEVELCPRQYINEIFEMEGFLDALAEVQTNVNDMTKKLGKIPEYPQLMILGTSSTANTKMRNTSGMLLRIDEERSIIMDCGEGIVNQLFRIYGDKTDSILATVKAIYISHLHADHQLGLIGVLQERSRITKEPVYLIAPDKIHAWLQFYEIRYEPVEKLYILTPNSKLTFNQHTLNPDTEGELYEALNVQDISTVPVNHCAFSYGVALTLTNGQKIVYSGDTMPCENLVKLGRDCDLLIHEATIGDDNPESASLKLHSTVSQAIEMGDKMNSKFTLLTHFSQRFAKTFYLPEIEDRPDFSKIGMAFDNMRVRLGELPILPLFYPCLKIMCFSNVNVLQNDEGIKTLGRLKTRRQKEIDKLDAITTN